MAKTTARNATLTLGFSMAKCPNCNVSIPWDSKECTSCNASFEGDLAWHPAPETPAEEKQLAQYLEERRISIQKKGIELNSDSVPKKSLTPVLIVILVLELLSLFPWLVISALGAMGFDSGFNWGVVLFLGPFWAYPFLIAICGFVAFALNRDGKGTAAVITILLPPLISGVGPFLALFGLSIYEYMAYKPEFDVLCKKAKVVVLEVVPPAKSIAIVPEISSMRGPRRLLLAPDTPLQFVEAEAHDLQGKVSLVRVTSVRDKTDDSTDPLAQRRTFVESPIDAFSAEYLVIPSIIKMPQDLTMRIYGQKIEVLRASDKKPISYAEYYYGIGNDRACPEGISREDFVSEFISKSLNIPKRR